MESTASERKIAANRENAKKSTGPRTDTGKAISSLNSMTHGIFARSAVALGPPLLENPAEFLVLLESLRAQFAPFGMLEDAVVQQIADAIWKAARLARYEAAGVTERLYAAISAIARKDEVDAWTSIPLQSDDDREPVTAKMLRDQIDLVNRLSADGTQIEEDRDFLAFALKQKNSGNGAERKTTGDGWVAEARDHVKSLPEKEREDLKSNFRSEMASALKAMFLERANRVPMESAFGRSLIPDDAEMEKIIRYSNYLSRQVERKIKTLLNLQAVRCEQEGGAGA